MDWPMLGAAIYRGLYLLMESMADDGSPGAHPTQATPPVRCVRCGSEPWVIRWGNIRVGQDLSGYYYQATMDGAPDLLCRDCWHTNIGMDDPMTGKRAGRHSVDG